MKLSKGSFALQARDWGPARELLSEAADRDETDVLHLINLALAYTGLGHLSSTVETLQRALVVDARSPQASTYLGNAYYRLEQNSRAVGAWKRALEIDPVNEDAARALRAFDQDSSGAAS